MQQVGGYPLIFGAYMLPKVSHILSLEEKKLERTLKPIPFSDDIGDIFLLEKYL